jgi:membrane protein required for colicin V production
MTSLDWAVVAIVGFSTLFAFVRGVIREVVALIAWVAGFVLALALSPALSVALPDIPGHPGIRYLIAFLLILLGTLIVGALFAWALSKVVRVIGLGFVDRFLGAVFGLARGLVVVLALAVIAGLTTLPRSLWWQNSVFGAPIVAGVEALKPYLPQALAERLDYPPRGAQPRRRQGTQSA